MWLLKENPGLWLNDIAKQLKCDIRTGSLVFEIDHVLVDARDILCAFQKAATNKVSLSTQVCLLERFSATVCKQLQNIYQEIYNMMTKDNVGRIFIDYEISYLLYIPSGKNLLFEGTTKIQNFFQQHLYKPPNFCVLSTGAPFDNIELL